MLTGIIGTVKAALFRFYDRINTVGIGAGNSDPDLAEDSVGKAIALEMFPGNAVILGAIQSAARAAAGEKPRLSTRLPERCEDDVRIMRIENKVDAAGVFVF